MKKVVGAIIVLVILALVVGGVFLFYNKEQNNKELENAITPLAEDYFDKYMSANTVSNTYTVTLEDLKSANKNGEEYDLSKLNKCSDKTSVDITIDYKTGKVKQTKVKLDC